MYPKLKKLAAAIQEWFRRRVVPYFEFQIAITGVNGRSDKDSGTCRYSGNYGAVMENYKTYLRTRKIINICLIVMVAGAWISMTLYGKGTLAQNGLGNLKYFTVLSNFFEAIASAVWLSEVRKNGRPSDRAERLKYVAAASVGLTFVTVMGFLGPLYGYIAMFVGANLFFHLIVPVLSMAEMVFLSDLKFTRRDNNLTVIPPIIYGVIYIANTLINGIGEWPNRNDWYSFLIWGYPVGILIFAVLCLVTWLVGLMMRKIERKR